MSWITPELLDALRMVESSGNNDAVSSAGAVGEYQFMPENVHDMGYGVDKFDPKNPVQARKAAAQYLKGMQEKHGWTPEQTLQAYNWGPGNMRKFLKGEGEMPTETVEYVKKFEQFGWSPTKPEGVQFTSVPSQEEDNIPRVAAGMPSFSFDNIADMFSSTNDETTQPSAEINKMATPEAQAYFADVFRKRNEQAALSDGDQIVRQRNEIPSLVNGDQIVRQLSNVPTRSRVMLGKEPVDTIGEPMSIETLMNEPRTQVPESSRMDAYNYVDLTPQPQAEYVAPAGKEPAAQAMGGVLRDSAGNPVKSGNGNPIGLPTQNPAFKAPAGGKGANATPQSAIQQLTGIQGTGGK